MQEESLWSFEHVESLRTPLEGTLLAFWQIFGVLMSKSVIFGFKIASEAMQIKIPDAVLYVSVMWTRDYLRLKALMLENILNTHIMDARPIENFLQAPEPRGVTVFGPRSTKFRNFSTSKKCFPKAC